MLRHDLFLDPAEVADIDWGTRLSFQEFTFLTGLLVKRDLSLSHPSPDQMSSQIERTYKLFEELHAAHNASWFEKMHEIAKRPRSDSGDWQAASEEVFGGDAMTEPIFYGSSGAYDFQ